MQLVFSRFYSLYSSASIETYDLWKKWIPIISGITLLFHLAFLAINIKQGFTEPLGMRILAILVLLPYLLTHFFDQHASNAWLKANFLFSFTLTGPALIFSGLLLELSSGDTNWMLVAQRQYEFMAAVGILLIATNRPIAVATIAFSVCLLVFLAYYFLTPLSLLKTNTNVWVHVASAYVVFFIAFTFVIRIKNDQERNRMEAAFTVGSAVAHQLRTPLATIGNLARGTSNRLPDLVQGYRAAIGSGMDGQMSTATLNQLAQALDSITEEVRHSNALIDILIANSKPIEKLDPPSTPVSIRSVIDRAINGYPYNNPFERSLVSLASDSDFEVYATENMLLHALYNLIGNAVEFSQKSSSTPRVEISLSSSETWNIVSVWDSGPGVSRENQHRVFDPFFSQNSQNGTGIGLSFCKSVMEGLGGKIECHSEEGKFCEFVLYFPKQAPVPSGA